MTDEEGWKRRRFPTNRTHPTAYRSICLDHLERRQEEGVATVLDAESAEEVAVHGEHDKTPSKSSDTLGARVCHTGHLESKRDGCESKDSV